MTPEIRGIVLFKYATVLFFVLIIFSSPASAMEHNSHAHKEGNRTSQESTNKIDDNGKIVGHLCPHHKGNQPCPGEHKE
ncbi:MAG: hypothetical protein KKC21_00620, partial [Nitrospinae bacterium]|nr:hypothetical protein [Nitrospinota bacterium]